MFGNLLAEFESNVINKYISSQRLKDILLDKESRSLIQDKHKLLQTSWTAIFGSVAILEAIVLAWWAQKLYQVWSRLLSFVMAIHWPWQATNGVEVKDEVQPKQVRHRQAAIDARNE